MSELAWRKEPPDKPGWWLCTEQIGDFAPYIVPIGSDANGSLLDDVDNQPVNSDFFGNSLWAGPIEPPPRSNA